MARHQASDPMISFWLVEDGLTFASRRRDREQQNRFQVRFLLKSFVHFREKMNT